MDEGVEAEKPRPRVGKPATRVWTDRAARVIQIAERESAKSHRPMDDFDVMLAILDQGDSPAVAALHNLGMDRDRLLFAVARELCSIVVGFKDDRLAAGPGARGRT